MCLTTRETSMFYADGTRVADNYCQAAGDRSFLLIAYCSSLQGMPRLIENLRLPSILPTLRSDGVRKRSLQAQSALSMKGSLSCLVSNLCSERVNSNGDLCGCDRKGSIFHQSS